MTNKNEKIRNWRKYKEQEEIEEWKKTTKNFQMKNLSLR